MSRQSSLRRRVNLAPNEPIPNVLLESSSAAARREHLRVYRGFNLINKGYSFRKAARKVHMSPSTLYYKYTHNFEDKQEKQKRTALTAAEERRVVEVMLHYAENGRPLTRKDLVDVVEMLIKTMPRNRRIRLPFKDERPGVAFCRAFEKRHNDVIAFRTQRRQDAQRYKATNAEVLVLHFAKIEHLIREHSIDSSRIVNLDETGVSAWKEGGNSGRRGYTTRSHKLLTCGATFQNVNHITLLAAVHGNGEKARPLVVLQGTKLRIRQYQHRHDPSRDYLESIAECLPRGTLVTTRKDVAAVDTNIFKEWADSFIEDTKDLRANNRKILFIYDGYRSHLSIPVLQRFRENGIIAYALPAHTSGTTQPLDVGVFAPFKAKFRTICDEITKGLAAHHIFNEFDVCFRKTGIVPLDEFRLFAHARPYSCDDTYRIASVQEMVHMLDEKRRAQTVEILGDLQVQSTGFLDTSYGAVVTSDAALGLLKLQQEAKAKKVAEQLERERVLEEKCEAERKKKRVARAVFERERAKYRHHRYGDPIAEVRPLRVRAAAAKARYCEAHEARVLLLQLGRR